MSPPYHFMAKVLTLLPTPRKTWKGWLVQQMERMQAGGEKSFTDFEKYYPQVKATLDSLRTN